jgi:pimeloyl-ACP methyl ester carboxylesterase
MQRVNLNGVDLEYTVQGSGEPLVLIHGAILADAFSPLLAEPRIANTYRVIAYHRRGFAGSSRASAPFMIGQQAADGRALLRHLGVTRAHITGHSYGAAIALQWALDAPEEVQSLALLEAPWQFTAEEAARIRQPVLAVVGTESAPIFSEGHAVLKRWIPQTAELVVPQATHGLQMMNPRAVADGLARFFAGQKL